VSPPEIFHIAFLCLPFVLAFSACRHIHVLQWGITFLAIEITLLLIPINSRDFIITSIIIIKGKGHPMTGHEGPRGGVEV
jgi:hypothetical protein